MNTELYQKGYLFADRAIAKINYDEDTAKNMMDVLHSLDYNVKDLDVFLGARDAFVQDKYKMKNILMLLCSPMTQVLKLRMLGFTNSMYSLMTEPDIYKGVPLKDIKFDNVFIYDDRGMCKRALIGYIMDIPAEAFPLSDKFYDLKNKVWDACLDLAINLKDKYSILNNTSYDELTQIIIDCSYGDAIGNDEHGVEEFYNKFVDLFLINIRHIGASEVHDLLIGKLTEIGEMIIDELDWFWLTIPQRLMLYLRVKLQLFRLNPNIKEQWNYIREEDVYKGEW